MRSYPSPSEGRQNENHNYKKTNQTDHMDHSLVQLNETMSHAVLGTPKTDRSWWRVLTKCGPLEKGMANYLNILALRTP